MGKKLKSRFVPVVIIIAIIAVLSILFLKLNASTIPASNVTNLHYSAQSNYPPAICGGVGPAGWYLFSKTSQGPFTNQTVGMCAISSSPSCNYIAGYYGC